MAIFFMQLMLNSLRLRQASNCYKKNETQLTQIHYNEYKHELKVGLNPVLYVMTLYLVH